MLSMYPIGNDLYSGRRSLNIIGLRKVWFGIALLLILASLASILVRDPNLGIEFRGGSQFTVTGTEVTSHQPAYEAISKIGADDAPRVSSLGTSGLRVQTVELSDQQTQELKETLAAAYKVPINDVTSTFVGPSWGQNIMSKAIRAMIVFMVSVSLVLMLYFRSWTIAIGAIGALLHDFIITLGIYWLLGLEITPATIIGILTIMGYSLYDTVVVFDKVRENTEHLTSQTKYTFAESANLAINQTLIRSINTSLTGLLPVIAVLFIGVGILGADTLRDLALVMFVGMILSTVSSIFIAAPLSVTLGERNEDIKIHTERVRKVRAMQSASSNADKGDTVVAESDMLALAGVEDRISGGHLGQAAQPKKRGHAQRKKKRSK